MNKVELIKLAKRALPKRGRYYQGVAKYVPEIIERAGFEQGELNKLSANDFYARLLNGAGTWQHYSEGACSLVDNTEIAARLFYPHDVERLRRRDFCIGDDSCAMINLQARALREAADAITKAFRALQILDA